MSRRGDFGALCTVFFRKDHMPEICRVMGSAGLCRDHVCAGVINDARRNRACARKKCGVHPKLNNEWLAEAQKLASFDRGHSAQVREVLDLAPEVPPPCLAYCKAACYVEKRMVTGEEMRTGIPERPQRATTRNPTRSARASTRAPGSDLSDELSEAPPSTTTSDTEDRSTAPPSDADERNLPTQSTKTAHAKTPELKQALCEKTETTEHQDREVTAEMTHASEEEMREEAKAQEKMRKELVEAALTRALAQAHANEERLEKMLAEKKTPVSDSKKEELKEEATQTVVGGQDALCDVLRILFATSTPPERRISFVLENYGHHLS